MSRPSSPHRRHADLRTWAPALAILLLALAIRAAGLDAQGLFNEEGYSLWLSQSGLLRIVAQTASLDSNTPLHYLMLGAWVKLIGASELSVRLVSVFAGVATVAIGYALARTVAPRTSAATWAAALLAVWPISVTVSQEARMYAVLACLSLLAGWFMARGMRSGRGLDWAGWAIAVIAAFSAHVLGAVAFAAQAAVVLVWWVRRRRRRSYMPLAAVLAAAGVIVAWILVILLVSVPTRTTYGGGLGYFDLLVKSLAANIAPPLSDDAATAIVAGLCALLIGASFAWGNAQSRLLSVVVLLNVLAVAAVCAWTGKYSWRYGSVLAPWLPVVLSVALTHPRWRAFRWAPGLAGGALIGASLVGDIVWRADPANAHEDFRGAAHYLRAQVADDEAVIILPDFSAVFDHYYGRGDWHPLPEAAMLDVEDVLDYESAVPALNRALAGKQGVWLLSFDETLMDPAHLAQQLLRRQSQAFGPQLDTDRFARMRLQHFRFFGPYQPLPDKLPALSSQVERIGAERGLGALGCHSFSPLHAGDPWMEVACFWQVEPGGQVPVDTQVSLRLYDDAGRQVLQSDQNLAPFGLPYLAYNKPITSFYVLFPPNDLAPGRYTLRAIPYAGGEQIAPQVSTPLEVLPGR